MADKGPGLEHGSHCLMKRYEALPSEDREWWPPGFSSRPDLCSCGAHPNAEALRPEHAGDRHELENYLALFNRG